MVPPPEGLSHGVSGNYQGHTLSSLKSVAIELLRLQRSSFVEYAEGYADAWLKHRLCLSEDKQSLVSCTDRLWLFYDTHTE